MQCLCHGCVYSCLRRVLAFACAQFLDNTLSPYPGQIGDGSQSALIASNGDGIHSISATLGPLVRGNTLVNMGDDGITVHGLFFLVVAVRPPHACVEALGTLGTLNMCRRQLVTKQLFPLSATQHAAGKAIWKTLAKPCYHAC